MNLKGMEIEGIFPGFAWKDRTMFDFSAYTTYY
jgi:hypothetical protein